MRLFNASGDGSPQELGVGFKAAKIELVELDGRVIEELKTMDGANGGRKLSLQIPRFGIRTLRFSDFKSARQQ